jgi:hypothetical protein
VVISAALADSELLAACLEGHSVRPAMVRDATCYSDDDPIGSDHIKVGEALFSVDPLSSQGVQTALGTALHLTAVVHTTLRRPEDRETAEQFYRERRREAVAFRRSTSARLYNQVALEREEQFWQERAGEHALQQEWAGIADMTPARKRPTRKMRIRLAPETGCFPHTLYGRRFHSQAVGRVASGLIKTDGLSRRRCNRSNCWTVCARLSRLKKRCRHGLSRCVRSSLEEF